jgi:hypothetical protein
MNSMNPTSCVASAATTALFKIATGAAPSADLQLAHAVLRNASTASTTDCCYADTTPTHRQSSKRTVKNQISAHRGYMMKGYMHKIQRPGMRRTPTTKSCLLQRHSYTACNTSVAVLACTGVEQGSIWCACVPPIPIAVAAVCMPCFFTLSHHQIQVHIHTRLNQSCGLLRRAFSSNSRRRSSSGICMPSVITQHQLPPHALIQACG